LVVLIVGPHDREMACAAHVLYLLVNGAEKHMEQAFGLFCVAESFHLLFYFSVFILFYTV
jgi:hypothetical protein